MLNLHYNTKKDYQSMNIKSESQMNLYILFDQDTRIIDNHLIEYARKSSHKEGSKILGLFLYDQNIKRPDGNTYIENECSPLRLKFVLESLISFKKQLQSLGNDLICFDTSLADFLLKDVSSPPSGRTTLAYTISLRNNRVIEEVKRSIPEWEELFHFEGIWGSTIHCIQDLKVSYRLTIEQVFQEYSEGLSSSPIRPIYRKVQRGDLPLVDHHQQLLSSQLDLLALYRQNNQAILQDPLYARMATNDLHHSQSKQEGEDDWMWRTNNNVDNEQVQFLGGEQEGLKRLKKYLDSNALADYKHTKVQLYGRNFSSKLSCWLSSGCLSPRFVYLKVQAWGEEHGEEQLARLFNDHLLIKDYQIYQAHNFQEAQVLSYGGIFNNQERKWLYDQPKEQAFMEGRTGLPFVDACLQEAMATGYLSNRGRQVIAGYFSIEMHLDWRTGYKFFQRHFLDFHQEQCALSWQNVIGLFKKRFTQKFLRQFELEKQHNNPNAISIQQGMVYDPQGQYIHRMLPQLKKLPTKYLHEPWTMLSLGKDYIVYLKKVYVLNEPQLRAFLQNQKKGKSNFDIDYDKQIYGRKKKIQQKSEQEMSSTLLNSIKSNS